VDEFHIEVWRSFEDYLIRWLTESAQDFTHRAD
jgi:sarcosine oxidase gamma subunit